MNLSDSTYMSNKRATYIFVLFLLVFISLFFIGCSDVIPVPLDDVKQQVVNNEKNFDSYKELGTSNITLNNGILVFYKSGDEWRERYDLSEDLMAKKFNETERIEHKTKYWYETPVTVVAEKEKEIKYLGKYDIYGENDDVYIRVIEFYVFEYPNNKPLGYFTLEGLHPTESYFSYFWGKRYNDGWLSVVTKDNYNKTMQEIFLK